MVGPFSPGQGAKYIKSGAIREGFIWNPMLAGEVIVYVGNMLAEGQGADRRHGDSRVSVAVTVDPATRNIQAQKLQAINKDNHRRARRDGPLTDREGGALTRRPQPMDPAAPFLRLTAVSKRFGGVAGARPDRLGRASGRGALPRR